MKLLFGALALTCACSSTDATSQQAAGGVLNSSSGAGAATVAGGMAAGGAGGGSVAAAGAGNGGKNAAGAASGGNAGTATSGGQGGAAGLAGAGQAGSGGQAGSAGQAGSPATLELHITSSNIRYGTADDGINAWDKRKALLFTVLKAQTFDSAGLQEALSAQLAEFDTTMPEYGRVGVGRNDGKTAGEYSAILYLKARYEVVDSGTFWLSDTPEVPGSMTWGNTLPRICTWARLKHLQTGQHYYHYNLHLDNVSQPSREKSAQLVAARIAARAEPSERVILTGDFNAVPSDLAVTYLLGSQDVGNMHTPVTLKDAWLLLHDGDAATPANTFHSFNGGTDGAHIDYIMFGTGVTAKSAEIIRTHDAAVYPSDHYPVSAVLDLAP